MRTLGYLSTLWHRRAGLPVREDARLIPSEETELRMRLLIEEFFELLHEMMPTVPGRFWLERHKVKMLEDFAAYVDPRDGLAHAQMSLPAIAAEMADLCVVTGGAADHYGVDIDRAVEIKMDANLDQKLEPCPECYGSGVERTAGGTERCSFCNGQAYRARVRRGDGKIVKPDDWVPPDLQWALRRRYRDPADVPDLKDRKLRVGVDPETMRETLIESEEED